MSGKRETEKRRRGETEKGRRITDSPVPRFTDSKKAGFTLLELLVAMVITVLLGAALSNVFNLAGRAWKKGEARTQRYQNLRQALDRMSEEIRSAILLSSDNNPAPKDLRFYGCANRNNPGEYGEELNFISVSNPPEDWEYSGSNRFDCCEITYYILKDDDTGETRLMRRLQTSNVPDTSIIGGGGYFACAERITHLNFTYYDADGNDYDTWDSSFSGTLPVKVRIELTAQARSPSRSPSGEVEVMLREAKEETFTTEVWLAHANFQ